VMGSKRELQALQEEFTTRGRVLRSSLNSRECESSESAETWVVDLLCKRYRLLAKLPCLSVASTCQALQTSQLDQRLGDLAPIFMRFQNCQRLSKTRGRFVRAFSAA